MFKFLLSLFLLISLSGAFSQAWSQSGTPEDLFSVEDDDLNIGGDIFSDFNEDLEATQVMEDERFYRFGRFFSVAISLGLTTFDGNRGTVYENDHPSYGIGLNYFLDFQSSFGLGFEFSKHHMILDHAVNSFKDGSLGLVDVSMLRVYFSYRYYIDTSNLGTAITYANPYFTGRLEYWYTTNKFKDQPELGDDSGGGLGFGVGFGGEFPIKLKESYVGVEFLYHTVNYHDKYTNRYQPVDGDSSKPGIADLSGNSWSTMISYVFSW